MSRIARSFPPWQNLPFHSTDSRGTTKRWLLVEAQCRTEAVTLPAAKAGLEALGEVKLDGSDVLGDIFVGEGAVWSAER
jgi:hypothetical protein